MVQKQKDECVHLSCKTTWSYPSTHFNLLMCHSRWVFLHQNLSSSVDRVGWKCGGCPKHGYLKRCCNGDARFGKQNRWFKSRKVKFTKVVMQWCFTLQSFWEWLTHRVLQAKVSEESVSKAAVQVGKTGESLAHQAGLGKRELGKIWINTRDTLNLFHLFEGCYKYR